MRMTEATASTRKDAIQRGLEKLGVELHEVEIEILDEGSKGFLGIGQRDVHVRIKAEHLSDDGSANVPDENWGNREQPPRSAQQAARTAQGRTARRGGRSGRGRVDNKPARQRGADQQPSMARPARTTESNRQRPSSRSARPQRTPKPSRSPRKEPQRQPRTERSRPRRERTTPIDREAAETLGRSAAALLSEIIEKMGMKADVTNSLNEEENIVLDVSTEDSAILIGRKGRNCEALQFVMNRIFLKGEEQDIVDRIIVDVEGYLRRRKESLEEMARSLAQRAKDSGRSVRVKPLDPQERRIIHLTLEDDPDVRTFSLGSSLHRRVVIEPAGAANTDDRDDQDWEDDEDYSDEREDQSDEGESPVESIPAKNTSGEPNES